MKFQEILAQLPEKRSPLIQRFEDLLEPKHELESMAAEAQSLTRQYFGKTMRLFAPIYVSNECVNTCKYCGFSRHNAILRLTLTEDQVEQEALHLVNEGFRNLLLVAGEHPRFVSPDYLSDCVRRIRKHVPSVSIEVAPMEVSEYEKIVHAGAEGIVVFQETYDRNVYADMHVEGPKKDFDWRVECPERAYEAGFRRIGIGALLGLADWRHDVVALAAHAEYLLKKCWTSYLSISLPRLRPAAGEFKPRNHMTDRQFIQFILALRICFPQVGLVLSTRESPKLRDGLMGLGITMMSAGAHTEPGGYTHVGNDDLHLTVRGRRQDIVVDESAQAEVQFSVSDDRSPAQVVARLKEKGLDPVWKDWECVLNQ